MGYKVRAKSKITGKTYFMMYGSKRQCITYAKKLNEVTQNDFIRVIREADETIVFEIDNTGR